MWIIWPLAWVQVGLVCCVRLQLLLLILFKVLNAFQCTGVAEIRDKVSSIGQDRLLFIHLINLVALLVLRVNICEFQDLYLIR